MLTTLTATPDIGIGTFKRPDTKYHNYYCTCTNSLIHQSWLHIFNRVISIFYYYLIFNLFHLKDKKGVGTPTDLIQSTMLSSISAALCSFPPRWCKAVHCVSETGGGLPSGPLLSDGSFIFNEGWFGSPSHLGQWARCDHGPHHKQPTHGVWSLCGQDRVPLHVHLSSRGSEKPLLWVGGEAIVGVTFEEEKELRWRFSNVLRKSVQLCLTT